MTRECSRVLSSLSFLFTVAVWATLARAASDRGLAASSLPTLPGLVSYWRGEGNAQDSVGPNDGTLHGDTSFATGRIGQAFGFDGHDDYVLMPGTGVDNLQQFTIFAWIMLNEVHNRWVTCLALGNDRFVLRGDFGQGELEFYMKHQGNGAGGAVGQQLPLEAVHTG